MHKLKKFTLPFSVVVIIVLIVTGIFVTGIYRASATTLGESISTTGTLTVTNSSTTATTGSIDLDLTAAGSGVKGQDITLNAQIYTATGQQINLNSTSPTSAATQTGQAIYLSGTTESAANFIGSLVATASGSSTANGANYVGSLVNMDANNDLSLTAVNLQNTGVGMAYWGSIQRSAGTGGQLKGMQLNVKNTGTSSASLYGAVIRVDVSGSSTGSSKGLFVEEEGSGTLQDGVFVKGDITDGVDVSDGAIVNSINIGNNPIIANGSVSIDLNNSGADILTITNSNAGGSALASVEIEGGLTIGKGGSVAGTAITKHLSTTSSIDDTNLSGNLCESFTVSLTGVAAGDTVLATPGADGSTALSSRPIVWSAFGTANTINLRVCNTSTTILGADPSAVTWRFDVWQH